MLVTLMPLILIVGVFWLLVLRPAKAKQARQAALLSTVQPGQRIITTAGLYGTVTEVTDEDIVLEIAPGIEVRYVKAAILRVLDDEDVPADAEVADLTDAATDRSTASDTVAVQGAAAEDVPADAAVRTSGGTA